MQKSVKAYLLSSGTLLIVVIGLIFSGQLLYYHQRLLTLRNTVHYNTAITLRNLAISNGITNENVIIYSAGTVTKKEHLFVVKLSSGAELELNDAHY
ncbi:hypothetical protein [Liquorilactobacillus satsumensis]|uniref:Uncharacterized protein n=1 Tax=Liquorilactobacillus satsumensis DSM 16230 = JCM 12392 TaxID=1423801 RepID=A0A0R1VA82_9LACO|nr:hypothetical protein [Liquorilactobacillus satsumensis]KRM00548.1 hypothetical protein FD50_GL000858 [Liquorilactobacillus satsumensis DSM 16230 = JCM 12392]MCC7667399.1 hypothetical protein [Liquorilactobacillus satsumensis]MCP9313258.1 hypothetical protein [Liquorilactobacillus satsumensis]MCP9329510.1 hypothetical protein [Liquorilactobacillus satsumensis]MCP9358615.1 hypothetical protein [Liquorilactobacillus satsumensis]